MKDIYVRDINENFDGKSVTLKCWIKSRRSHGSLTFLDLIDSSGEIQAIASSGNLPPEMMVLVNKTPPESAVCVEGQAHNTRGTIELLVENFVVVGLASKRIDPPPRSNFEFFDDAVARRVMDDRHLYIRNPQFIAVLRFRDRLLKHIREFFTSFNFVGFEAPILTPVPLYEDETAMPIIVNDERVFLTQCVGFYLEAAAHSLERVYNIGPSFRGEESRSKRHLMEYWHIKAEAAWYNLDDMMVFLERMINYAAHYLEQDFANFTTDAQGSTATHLKHTGPFRRVGYAEAFQYLKREGFDIEYGQKMRSAELASLTTYVGDTFWMCGIPRQAEPFPYCLDPSDNRLTMVADLIMSDGHGALGGVAEKIFDAESLQERMIEKGKNPRDGRHDFIMDIHKFGCVPHAAFGIGLERLIRWYLGLPHVRDAIGFPRVFRRKVYP